MATHNEPISTRLYLGARPKLMPIRELEPEDARWVWPPRHAWGAIAAKAGSDPHHHDIADDARYVDDYSLAEFMDDVLGQQWRNGFAGDPTIQDGRIRRMRDELEAGRWVVLGWQPAELWPVEWKADPEQEGGGQWQVRTGAWQFEGWFQHALQHRLDEAYRILRIRAGPARTRQTAPGGPETERMGRPRRTANPGPASIDPPRVLSKAQRWQTRKRLIAAGSVSPTTRLQAAAERLARNNVAVEKARLADHVYAPDKPVPEGWKNRSGDVDFLKRYHLKTEYLKVKGSNFRAQLYEPDADIFGDDMKPTLAFKGTDMASFEDWVNNARQSVDLESTYYETTVGIGRKLLNADEPIDITGHSLGGGLCAVASVVSGKDCWSFNAAGLHPNTVKRYDSQTISSNVNAYHVNGDILTLIQQWTPLPDAIGHPYPLPGKGWPLSRHSIKQVIDGIETQKIEDTSILEAIP